MKKRYLFSALGLTAVLLLAGCGNDKNKTSETAAESETTAAQTENTDTAKQLEEETGVYEESDFEDESGLLLSETEAGLENESDLLLGEIEAGLENESDLVLEEIESEYTIAPITPSEYLIKDASKYVTLGDYDNLEVIQYTYEVTDSLVKQQIDYELEAYGTEEDIDTPSDSGDTIYLTLKSQVQGSDAEPEEENTFFIIGNEDYGAAFDQELIGVSAGETKQFSITFGDEIWMDEWIDQTVDFEISVESVTRLSVPEYNDAFIADYTDYSSKEEFEDSIRQSLEAEYTDISYSDAIEMLFQAALEQTTFDGYPQDLYDTCYEESMSFYRMFGGGDGTNDEEVLDAFGITAEDIDTEVRTTVYQRLLISAYCQANDITATEEEYLAYLEKNAEYYGAYDAASFEEEYGRDALVLALYQMKVADELYAKANVTKVSSEDLFSSASVFVEDFDYTEESLADGENDTMIISDSLEEDSELETYSPDDIVALDETSADE